LWLKLHLQLQEILDMESAKRIMQQILEGMLLMVVESSWLAMKKEQVGLLHVLLVVVIGTFIEEKCKLKLFVSTLHLIMVAKIIDLFSEKSSANDT
jgi:hypothetical protein